MTIKKARTTERSYELISHPRTTEIPHLFNQIIKGTVYSYASVNSFLASEFTYFLLEMFFVLRLLAQDLLTYSMCLTKSNSFSDRLHLSLSLQQGKDLLRILTGFRSKYLYTYKRMYSPTLLPILKLHPYRITILNFTPY